MVDFADSPEQAAFRAQVREFIQTRLPEELKARPEEARGFDEEEPEERKEALKQWRAALVEKGWAVEEMTKQRTVVSDLSSMREGQ